MTSAVATTIDKIKGSHSRKEAEQWNPEKALETALREREQLLSSRPELKKFQSEIDDTLSGADSFDDKVRLLGGMIKNNLSRLHNECLRLEHYCKKAGIESELPLPGLIRCRNSLEQIEKKSGKGSCRHSFEFK